MLKINANFRDVNTDPYFKYIRDKYSEYPINFWYDKFPQSIDYLTSSPYNFLFIHEPNEFFNIHNAAIKNQDLFTCILTWSEDVIDKCPNAIKFTYNGRTLDDKFIEDQLRVVKEPIVSFLCGDKNLVEGHALRQKVYEIQDQLTIRNRWYKTMPDYDKATNSRPGYEHYSKDLSHIPEGVDPIGYGRRPLFEGNMFNVVIENVNHKNWYNKIGDNFLTKTVPIYWGCENLEEFGYDERGIIRFKDEVDLLDKLGNLTKKTYLDMVPFIEHNYQRAKIDDFEHNISAFFDEFIKLNNL